MKLFLLTIFALTCFAKHTPELHPRKFCMTARFRCAEDYKHFTDQDGRCGCLTKYDYMSAKECMATELSCPKHTTYSELYSPASEKMVGCGCFATKH